MKAGSVAFRATPPTPTALRPSIVQASAPVTSVQPCQTRGKVVAFALRRIGQEWPLPGWSSSAPREVLAGCEVVKITVEPA